MVKRLKHQITFGVAMLALCPLSQLSAEQPPKTNQSTACEIKLSELPMAPKHLAELIQQGRVRLFVGERKPSADSGTGNPGSSMAAITHFDIGFDYQSRSRWTVRPLRGKRLLTINVTYSQISMKRSHEIWFRERPESNEFWENRLVLHEFDHVRLSSDPTLDKTFMRKLRDSKTITEEVRAGTRVSESYVRDVIDRQVKKEFAEMIDLVDIRYKELDRQTSHGRQPLPKDSSLSQWLR